MRDRILLQTLIICLLIGAGTYLMMGSADSMQYLAKIAGTVGLFLTQTAPVILASPQATFVMIAMAVVCVLYLSRKSFLQVSR